MTHRKLARFISLSAACVVSLGLGAYLSYEASLQVDGGQGQSFAEAADTRAVSVAQPAVAADRAPVLQASLEAARAAAVFAPTAPALEMALRSDDADHESAASDSAPTPAQEGQEPQEKQGAQKLAALPEATVLPDLPPAPDFAPAMPGKLAGEFGAPAAAPAIFVDRGRHAAGPGRSRGAVSGGARQSRRVPGHCRRAGRHVGFRRRGQWDARAGFAGGRAAD